MGQDKTSNFDLQLEIGKNLIKEEKVKGIITKDKIEEKKHKCTFPGCDKAFNRPSRLARHVRVHTGERCYKCNFSGCDKAYTNTCHLKRHMETHSLIKKLYQCAVCLINISSQHNLKRHYKQMHTDIRKLTCTECNETFTKKYQLQAHIEMHTPIVHKCDQCNKSFTSMRKFQRHKKAHEENIKSYICPMPGCNEVFAKWVLLCAHKKSQHTVDYKCKTCDKVFLTNNHLKVHSQVHSENRSVISCPYEKCPRVYYFKKNLEIHIKTYHLNQKYECDICKLLFASKQKVADHIKKFHMSETVIKRARKLKQKKRKDAGKPKRSMVSKLVGVSLSPKVEKLVLERQADIKYIEQFVEVKIENEVLS